MKKRLLFTASVFGFTGVCLGALASHWLRASLSEISLRSFETGVRYQIIHALFLLAITALVELLDGKYVNWIYRLTLYGVILFSGSIYLLSTSSLTGLKTGLLGPLTPLGGIMLIASWAILGIASWKVFNHPPKSS